MKIDWNERQYWDLLRAAYMADWVANSFVEEDKSGDGGLRKLRDYVFSLAEKFGYGECVEEGPDGALYPSLELEEEPSVRGLIGRYNDDVFWDELALRLAERDMIREFGEGIVDAMSNEEYARKIADFEERWMEELEQNGIDHLDVD